MSLTTRQKPPSHHKKASGDHHRRSKHYLKAYHPYLPLLVLVIVGLAINTLWSSQVGVLGATTNVTTTDLLRVTNAERYTNHESALTLNSALSAAAQAKANDMVIRNYWSHNTPDGRTPWTFIAKAGYDYQAAGENLAYGFRSADSAVTGWMNSPEHRANILNNNYQDVGFGVANADNYDGQGPVTVMVAMYGEPVFPSNTSTGTIPFSAATTTTSAPPLRSVARIQLLTGGAAPWSVLVLGALGALAIVLLTIRHVLVWKRVLVESEAFIIHHKYLDVLFVSLALLGFVLTRSSGFIH